MQSYSNRAYMHSYYSSFVYLHTFARTNVGVFFILKCAKLSTICIMQTFATTDAIALIDKKDKHVAHLLYM